jgi:hypothetical protein
VLQASAHAAAKTSEQSSQAPSHNALQAAWVPYRVALLAARASACVYAEGLLALHSEAAACPAEGFAEVAEGPQALQAAQPSRSVDVAEGPPALQVAPPSQVEGRPVEP